MPKITVNSFINRDFFEYYLLLRLSLPSIFTLTIIQFHPFPFSSNQPSPHIFLPQNQSMATHLTVNKHNMIANLDKTQLNVDFHGVIDFLTGSSINYALLVNPDIIGPWIQEFWATTTSALEEEESFIRATVAG